MDEAQREFAHEVIKCRVPPCAFPRTEAEAEAFWAWRNGAKASRLEGIEFKWHDFRDTVLQAVRDGLSVDATTAAATLKHCDLAAVELEALAALRRLAGEPEDRFHEGDRVTADGEQRGGTVTKRRANGTFTLKIDGEKKSIVMTAEGLTHKGTVRWIAAAEPAA